MSKYLDEESRAYYTSVAKQIMYSLIKNYQVKDKPLASSLGALTNEEMRIGTVSLSIGDGSTGLVLYQAGRPFKIRSFPIGGDHITNDLAGVLRISLEKAEDLKKRLFTEEEETLRSEGIDVGLALYSDRKSVV